VMAVKVTLTRTIIGGPPKIRFPEKTWRDVGDLVVGDIRERVYKQETIDGGRIKENAPSTLDSKKRRGKPLKSLIDKMRRFVKKQFFTIATRKNAVVVGHTTPDVLRWVQEMGYVDWFGLGPKGAARVRERFVKDINDARNRAAKKRRKVTP